MNTPHHINGNDTTDVDVGVGTHKAEVDVRDTFRHTAQDDKKVSEIVTVGITDSSSSSQVINKPKKGPKDMDMYSKLYNILIHQPYVLISGWRNVPLLICISVCIYLSGVWQSQLGNVFTLAGVSISAADILRDVLLCMIGICSLSITNPQARRKNNFTWFPILEVAQIFFGIFVTMIPTVTILNAGQEGKLAFVESTVNPGGVQSPMRYFVLCGLLSSFLDNAPSFLLFFEIAGGDPVQLMGEFKSTLLAIVMGSVFMGTLTYIGNAPNFMVKSICEEQGTEMPSFGGFFLWVVICVGPVFLLSGVIFL